MFAIPPRFSGARVTSESALLVRLELPNGLEFWIRKTEEPERQQRSPVVMKSEASEVCSALGCDRTVHCKGFCNRHYLQDRAKRRTSKKSRVVDSSDESVSTDALHTGFVRTHR